MHGGGKDMRWWERYEEGGTLKENMRGDSRNRCTEIICNFMSAILIRSGNCQHNLRGPRENLKKG